MQPVWQKNVLEILPNHIVRMIKLLPDRLQLEITEVRLRVNQPLLVVLHSKDYEVNNEKNEVYICEAGDIEKVIQLITRNSMYALEQELRYGYITIPGGHRVGLAGQAVIIGGQLKTFKHFSSVNIRIAREITGCADFVMPYLISPTKQVYSTLVISPPRAGKTTLLRDLIRQLSSGIVNLGFCGVQVGLVDERSEIAACYKGIPTMNVGKRVDILDGCPKAEGMLMLVRSMSPQLIVTDEIGRAEDVAAVREALNAGVRVIASVHAASVEEVIARPYVKELIGENVFERWIVLSCFPSPGTVYKVIGAQKNEVLYCKANGVRVCG